MSEQIHSNEDIKKFLKNWALNYGIASGSEFKSSFVAEPFPEETIDSMFNNELRATQIVKTILTDCKR